MTRDEVIGKILNDYFDERQDNPSLPLRKLVDKLGTKYTEQEMKTIVAQTITEITGDSGFTNMVLDEYNYYYTR
jgi:hypothetical protein